MKNSIPHDQIGIPLHPCMAELDAKKIQSKALRLSLFDLSSHARAKEAIEFGLKMRLKNYNIFVIGDDRSGRMTATREYLNEYVKQLPSPYDWVYVNNFEASNRPLPFQLPSGIGRDLEQKTKELIKNIWVLLNKLFNSSQFIKQSNQISNFFQNQIDQQTKDLQIMAKSNGYEVIVSADGLSVELSEDNKDEDIGKTSKDTNMLRNALNKLSVYALMSNQKVDKQINNLKQITAKKAIKPLFESYKKEFGGYLKNWIDEFKKDVLQNLHLFFDDEGNNSKINKHLLERYAINLMIDNSHNNHPQVVLEPNPTYENLFGQIKYRNNEISGGLETHFTMIRPGAFHRANGGILILRAESVATDEELWGSIKSALRDKKITISERYREGSLPLDDAPNPRSIPLDVQVFLVASPNMYYNFLHPDSDFPNYFKIRAEIDQDLPATPENLKLFHQLIKDTCDKETSSEITPCAISYLTAYSSRWSGDRSKLSARFELVSDILIEADVVAEKISSSKIIDQKIIEATLVQRRQRNAHFEDSVIDDIRRDLVLIDTIGEKVGLVNGLTVLNLGDRTFGVPVRISARTYVGDQGVVNIERLTEMSGPIQQKGAFILEGFLKGVFAQKFPLSCTCSLTFEQNYTDVEGDSASMAELIAIISSLSGVPVQQNLAITGSINQFGSSQVVGGIHQKVEGFHRLCKIKGFSGNQGVIIPSANITNLTVRPEVVEDIKNGNFHIWGVDSIYEAIELMLGEKAGVTINSFGQIDTSFKKDSVFYKAYKTLQNFHKAIQSKTA
jgi:predicted ATP-dependent protease